MRIVGFTASLDTQIPFGLSGGHFGDNIRCELAQGHSADFGGSHFNEEIPVRFPIDAEGSKSLKTI